VLTVGGVGRWGSSENKLSVPWFDYDKSLTWRCLNSNLRLFVCFTFIFIHLKNCVCLSCDVQVAGVV
jgi:hypothetical protein